MSCKLQRFQLRSHYAQAISYAWRPILSYCSIGLRVDRFVRLQVPTKVDLIVFRPKPELLVDSATILETDPKSLTLQLERPEQKVRVVFAVATDDIYIVPKLTSLSTVAPRLLKARALAISVRLGS